MPTSNAPAPQDLPSLGEKVRYHLDRFFSWSPYSRFVGLFLLSFSLVVLCGVLVLLVHSDDPEAPDDLLEALWWAMNRMADAGNMNDDKGTLQRAVAVLATLSGVGVVALLIGLVSSTVSDKLESLRKGESPVIDSGHTLVLGFGEKVFSILRELRLANLNQRSACVVILSPVDKEEVETAVRERMGDMKSTRVVVRQGSPHSPLDLKKVGAGRARSIILLTEHTFAHGEGEEAPDMGTIKTLLALRRVDGALTRNHAAVELIDGERRAVVEQLGAGGVEVVAMEQTLSRMMVQTARQNGLAEVYRELLTYEGSELYFKGFPELAGQPFGAAQWRMRDAVVLGYRRPAREGAPAACVLNPPDDAPLEPGDELIVLAEDDDSFALTAQHAPAPPPGFTGGAAQARTPERLFIAGSSPKLGDMLREFDKYVLAGSEALLMPGEDKATFTQWLKAEVGALERLTLRFAEGDPTSPEALHKHLTPDFSSALVVANTRKPAEDADAQTVMTVLLLRSLFRGYPGKSPRIISEILDPRTKDLLETDYGADFVVSAEMTSMLLAQVSERRDLNAVFADLFDSDGNELYLKRADCYAALGQATPWLSVQRVARERCEVALGYLQRGSPAVLNPKQSVELTLAEEDRIIVLAQDDAEARGNSLQALPPPAPAPVSVAARPPPASLESRSTTAGPRVAGPSTAPRPPLPPKPKA